MGWVDRLFKNFVITAGDFADFQELDDFFNTVMAITCVMCAGLAAGLTMGLLSLDTTKLEIKCRVGTEEEKRSAELVLPVVKKHHLLLVTLLLFNSIANETLPIFLGELVPNYLAILLAVFLILIFGEIIPSAFFTGEHQLRTSARLIPVVYFLIAVLYPIAYPISRLLDKFFGEDDEDSTTMTRSELEALVLMQQARKTTTKDESTVNMNKTLTLTAGTGADLSNSTLSISVPIVADIEKGTVQGFSSSNISTNAGAHPPPASNKSTADDGLSASEVNLMLGVLNLSKLTVGSAMIPTDHVYMISSSNRLDDRRCLFEILESGFSRIPVFYRQDKTSVIGYLLVKELIMVIHHILLSWFVTG